MKTFKLLLITSLVAFTCSLSYGQSHPKTYPTLPAITQGQFTYFGSNTAAVRDSLAVTDTARYIIPVTHTNDVNLYGNFNWVKIGAGTATLLMNFTQSNDGVTYYAVKKGAANSTYTKTLTLSASTNTELNFSADTVKFSGRYLKVELITSATASVKGKYWGLIKTNIK